jgi:putative iron-dependent peroxidase
MAGMTQSQPVLAPLSESAIFLTLVISDGGEQRVRDLLSDLAGLTRSVGFRLPDEQLSCVAGIGSAAWDRLFTGPAAATAALIDDQGDPFAGGSYVIVQKYLHDIPAWQAHSIEEQELVIGRRKLEDVEIDELVRPSDSHVSVNTIVDEDGTERQILRDNMPFGSVGDGEFGTYFIGYSATPEVTERMLRRMFIGEPVGNTDRILEVSTATTGGLYFVPSQDFLDDLPPAPEQPGRTPHADLGIGSPRASR